MFETEDFDLDEDFLKDIGEKEEEYYSQKHEAQIERIQPEKRRKTESSNLDLLSDITFDDEPDFARNTTKTIEPSPRTAENFILTSRKQQIFDIFKTSESAVTSNKNIPKIVNPATNFTKKESISSKNEFDENVKLSRKNLALEILRKGSTSSDKSQIEEIIDNFSYPRSSPLKQLSSDGQQNSRITNSPEEARRKSLMEIFKKPRARLSKSPVKSSPKILQKFSSRDRLIAAPRMALVRKFPGPAGLLPDCSDTNLDHSNFLSHLDDGKLQINEDHNDSDISDYCSQNTERLFSVGAWRTMLDDLPKDFLKGHEIGTIKRMAKSKLSGGSTRVPFLAGVIERIDHSFENPRIELKDLSDCIEGTMHADIPNAHPNLLEPGVVILLRNAGLLTFPGTHQFPGIQCHIMIAPKNVLAVYTEKSRLVTSPLMETIIGTADGSERSSLSVQSLKSLNTCPKIQTNTKETEEESSSAIRNNNTEISDFEDDDDDIEFACFNIAEIKDAEMERRFPNLLPKVNTKMADLNTENGETSKKMAEKVVDQSPANAIIGDRKDPSPRELEIEMKPKKISPLRSRLLQFRSKDVLTPPIREEMINENSTSNAEETNIPREDREEDKDSNSRGFGEHLLDSDNDTDDEILSQLDVDSIVTSYNSGN